MNELMKVVRALLEAEHPEVYKEKPGDEAEYPYIVFTSGSIFEVSQRNDVTIEVNIWDKSHDTMPVEALTDKIEKIMNRKSVCNDYLCTTFYKENRQRIEDTDDEIQHRQLIFTAQTYYK